MECLRACVVVHELVVHARIGCSAEERAFPQRLLISMQIDLRPPAAPQTMNLEDSVDYSAAAERLKSLLRSREWELTEHVSAAAGELLLREFPAADTVRIETRKFALADAAWAGSAVPLRRGNSG